jgi:hypothetical protein
VVGKALGFVPVMWGRHNQLKRNLQYQILSNYERAPCEVLWARLHVVRTEAERITFEAGEKIRTWLFAMRACSGTARWLPERII